MLSPPRSPGSTFRFFPSAKCCFRVALRISFATFAAAAFCVTGSWAHLQSLAVTLSQTPSVAQARAGGPGPGRVAGAVPDLAAACDG